MRYAIVADVHGNLESLRAVLADAAGRTDGLLALGDLVGYGADPVACLELVGERAAALVAGNHERGATGRLPRSWFNPHAGAATAWTRRRLDPDHRAFLDALPLTRQVGDATLVHASPAQPEEWDYLVDPADGFAAFPAFATRLCFVGHSHRPAAWSLGSSGPAFEPRPTTVTLEAGRRYIVNVGSVGQPRDGDPRAAYAIWDLDTSTVALRRVPYDVEASRRKIIAAGLPRFLADRLRDGV